MKFSESTILQRQFRILLLIPTHVNWIDDAKQYEPNWAICLPALYSTLLKILPGREVNVDGSQFPQKKFVDFLVSDNKANFSDL